MRRIVLERAALAGAGVGTAVVATSLASAPVTKAATWSVAMLAKVLVPLLLVGTAATTIAIQSVPVLAPVATFESPSRASSLADDRVADRAPRAAVAIDVASRAAVEKEAPLAAHHSNAPRGDADGATRQDLRELHEVERLLARGEAEAALARLDARGARRTTSVFAEELEGARVLALCASSRRDEARGAEERFHRQHPVSPIARRIERACASSSK
jgi:hypothetical protein